jgi:hypothetical protein
LPGAACQRCRVFVSRRGHFDIRLLEKIIGALAEVTRPNFLLSRLYGLTPLSGDRFAFGGRYPPGYNIGRRLQLALHKGGQLVHDLVANALICCCTPVATAFLNSGSIDLLLDTAPLQFLDMFAQRWFARLPLSIAKLESGNPLFLDELVNPPSWQSKEGRYSGDAIEEIGGEILVQHVNLSTVRTIKYPLLAGSCNATGF